VNNNNKGGRWSFPITWAEPNPKTYFFIELSLSTESYKNTVQSFSLFFITKMIKEAEQNLIGSSTSRPILNNRKTTPNSAIAFVP